jgi:hypothetical protein
MTSEEIPQYTGPAAYRGPSMGYLIQHHQLAAKIIEAHPQHPANILDRTELAMLREYVNAPETKVDILRARGIEVEDFDDKATNSLVAYCLVRDKFNEEEIEMLREWFKDPQVVADLEDPKYDS